MSEKKPTPRRPVRPPSSDPLSEMPFGRTIPWVESSEFTAWARQHPDMLKIHGVPSSGVAPIHVKGFGDHR